MLNGCTREPSGAFTWPAGQALTLPETDQSFSGSLWRPVHKAASQGLGHGVSFGQSFRMNLRFVSQDRELGLKVMLPARKTTGFLNKVIILALILSPRHLNFANIIRGIA